jgi:hypothetical protein
MKIFCDTDGIRDGRNDAQILVSQALPRFHETLPGVCERF